MGDVQAETLGCIVFVLMAVLMAGAFLAGSD